MANEIVPVNPGEFLLYQTDDGDTRVQVRVGEDTVWLTQKQMAELFQKDVRTIGEHIKNVFAEGELPMDSVIRNFRITAADGKQYDTQHYNLDVIISVGYRVKSLRGTQFRMWATQRLREYIVKGFTLDDTVRTMLPTYAQCGKYSVNSIPTASTPPLQATILWLAGWSSPNIYYNRSDQIYSKASKQKCSAELYRSIISFCKLC